MNADPLRVLSLFTGAVAGLDRGFDAGCHALGIATRAELYVEIEAFAVATLVDAIGRGALAPAPLWFGDVRRLRPPAADVVLAGFPCPPASCAGKRAGTDDTRWLWPEVVRVAVESGARFIFAENVAGLLTVQRGRAFESILGSLAEVGFDAEWTSLTASSVGAPHKRERVFILAHHQRRGLGERTDATLVQRAEGWWGLAAPSDGGSVADTGRGAPERGREPGDVRGEAEGPSGDRSQRERDGDASRDGGGHVADDARSAPPVGATSRGAAHGSGMADPEVPERRRTAVEDDAGRRTPEARGSVRGARALGVGVGVGPQGQHEAGAAQGATERGRGSDVADDGCLGRDAQQPARAGRERDDPRRGATGHDWPCPWPPGPGERDRWAAILEADPTLAPATVAGVCRLADGSPARLVRRSCVDELRALGNGVVEAQAEAATIELLGRVDA